MKCSKCGFKARDINGMRKHYLKKHPGAMKRGRKKARYFPKSGGMPTTVSDASGSYGFCPHCGGRINLYEYR